MRSAAGPLSEITVAAIDAFGDVVAQATTGRDGTYTLSTLPPGTFSLLTSGVGYGTALEGSVTTAEHQQLTLPDIVLSALAVSDAEVTAAADAGGTPAPVSIFKLPPYPTPDPRYPDSQTAFDNFVADLCPALEAVPMDILTEAVVGVLSDKWKELGKQVSKSFDAVKADYAKLVLAYIPLIKQVNAVVSEIQTLAQKTQTMLKDVQDHYGKFLRTRIPPDSYSTTACPPLPIPDPAQIIRDADNVLKNLGSRQ